MKFPLLKYIFICSLISLTACQWNLDKIQLDCGSGAGECEPNGTCDVATNTCDCDEGWAGEFCDFRVFSKLLSLRNENAEYYRLFISEETNGYLIMDNEGAFEGIDKEGKELYLYQANKPNANFYSLQHSQGAQHFVFGEYNNGQQGFFPIINGNYQAFKNWNNSHWNGINSGNFYDATTLDGKMYVAGRHGNQNTISQININNFEESNFKNTGSYRISNFTGFYNSLYCLSANNNSTTLIEYDLNLNQTKLKQLSNLSTDIAERKIIQQTENGDYFILENVLLKGTYLRQYNSNWEYTSTLDLSEKPYDLRSYAPTKDGGVLIAGFSDATDCQTPVVLKIDKDLNIIHEIIYNDFCGYIANTLEAEDGGWLLLVYNYELNVSYLLKTADNGAIE